jgi:hypothetical protein
MTVLKGGETAVASRFGRQAAEIGRAAMGLANEDRTRALLARAGFADVRTEEAPVRFIYRDVDDYERWVIDVAGPFAIIVRGLPGTERRQGTTRRGVRAVRGSRRLRGPGRRPLRGRYVIPRERRAGGALARGCSQPLISSANRCR